MPHVLKFTSVFVCPVTGEKFCSGRYGDERYYSTQAEEEGGLTVVWYSKKILAEHGAAARALDCLTLRENNGKVDPSFFLCQETPYMTPVEAPPLPQSRPFSLKALEKKDVISMEVANDDGKENITSQMEDADECEDDYEQLRIEYQDMRKNAFVSNPAIGTAAAPTNSQSPFLNVETQHQQPKHPLQCGPEEAKAWLGTDLVTAMDADGDEDENKGNVNMMKD